LGKTAEIVPHVPIETASAIVMYTREAVTLGERILRVETVVAWAVSRLRASL
jgi:16S rRNA U1498 N3-methylase RsmE